MHSPILFYILLQRFYDEYVSTLIAVSVIVTHKALVTALFQLKSRQEQEICTLREQKWQLGSFVSRVFRPYGFSRTEMGSNHVTTLNRYLQARDVSNEMFETGKILQLETISQRM